jgi:aminoglycoside phosphotransferase family enzyme/predicted kinase
MLEVSKCGSVIRLSQIRRRPAANRSPAGRAARPISRHILPTRAGAKGRIIRHTMPMPSSPEIVGFVPSQVLTPGAFAHPVTRLEFRETHISWIVLTGPFVYKIKKPLRLEFLDASTLTLRQRLCEEELRLNRRLAADLYVSVEPITQEGATVRIGGAGRILDYAVCMKQFDASQELASLLDADAVSGAEISALALRLADFHAAAPRAPPDPGFPHSDQLQALVLGNLATLLAHLGDTEALPELGRLIDWTHDELGRLRTALRGREQHGFVRECHGDLHAGNIVRWGGSLVPFDCLEFDPKLRWIDVMNDVAFLVMDLCSHRRTDLASAFLNAYLERSGDYPGVRLLRFYSVYRALVRAMVDSLEAQGGLAQCGLAQGSAPRGEPARGRLRRRVETAARFMDHAPPMLILMHGVSGSGKSWLSERIALKLGAVRIRSDVERQRLAGPAPDPARYSPAFSRRTYARLLECAAQCLRGGFDTLVDAAFLQAEERRRFESLAAAERARHLILSCAADPAELERRVSERRRAQSDVSEADLAVLARQTRTAEPLDASERPHAIIIDTAAPQALDTAIRAIGARRVA